MTPPRKRLAIILSALAALILGLFITVYVVVENDPYRKWGFCSDAHPYIKFVNGTSMAGISTGSEYFKCAKCEHKAIRESGSGFYSGEVVCRKCCATLFVCPKCLKFIWFK